MKSLGNRWIWIVAGMAACATGSAAQAAVSPSPQAATLSSVTSLQCPSRTLCVGLRAGFGVDIGDGGANFVTSHAPRSRANGWVPGRIDGGRMLKLLTCASVRWCVAVDQQDRIVISTDPTRGAASWRVARGGPARVLDNVSALSCPTSHLCVGVAGHYVISSRQPGRGGTAWRQALVNQEVSASAIDCPSTTRCVAAGPDRQVSTSPDPTARIPWAHIRLDVHAGGFGPASVSCASTIRCVVTDGNLHAFSTINLNAANPVWHRALLGPSRVAHHQEPVQLTVSCTTRDVCAAAGTDGSVWASPSAGSSGRRHWTRVAVDGPVATATGRLISIACVRGQLCVATDTDGHALSANAVTRPGAWRRETIGRSVVNG
jgi:hypothetical protein